MFELSAQLDKDSDFLINFPLSEVRLMNDMRFPWLILVPKRNHITEIYQLEPDEQQTLWQEISFVTQWAKEYFSADKMNVATMGNRVPQLHFHVVARKVTDVAWPAPVWGYGDCIAYGSNDVRIKVAAALKLSVSLSKTSA